MVTPHNDQAIKIKGSSMTQPVPGAVRTRVAPSPTGAPHIGTAYMALFNYAFARHAGGQFLLRIEDTDRERSTAASEAAIIEALRWLGLDWDEGPDVGGSCGPYRQSERFERYREHAARLVASGHAYPCFCTAERLAALRQEQEAAKSDRQGYDGHCAAIAPDEARARIAAGEPHVIRLRVPREGDCIMRDRLREDVRIPWGTVDDQILVKSDGFPTYHLANVVDDHAMAITHVIRGEEWISSLPKHLLLYAAFGWEAPEFIHLPLLRNPDKSKLSKRKNPTGVLYYRRAGFLPAAILNYLGLMAYSPPDGNEVFSLEDMCRDFDIDRISLGGPVFDLQKLRSFNGRAIRALSDDALATQLKTWMLNDDTWRRIIPLAKPRLSQLADLVPMTGYLFADRLDISSADLLATLSPPERIPALLRTVQWEIERRADWDAAAAETVFDGVAEREDLKLKELLPLFFVTLSGSPVALPLFESMELLGRDLCLQRIQQALSVLEADGVALTGKGLKRFTKEYEVRYGRLP